VQFVPIWWTTLRIRVSRLLHLCASAGLSGAVLDSDVSAHPHCRELVELRERLAKKEGDGEALESEIEVCTSDLPLCHCSYKAVDV
jgi:hypothetical protein